jgi:putative glutamine amidotransferase
MPRPVIGVAFPRPDYLTALERAGADVRVLSPDYDGLPAALDGLDGVLLTGGADVDPSHYGATTMHPTVDVDPVRDAYELPLARAALSRQLPLLAICRGVQVLNVAAGGTLVQDLPSSHASSIDHAINEPRDAASHDVTIADGTRLAQSLGGELHDGRVAVNSRHHQAIDQLAGGFVVSAVAPDGVIEAIERPDGAFCLGVQWHPENFHASGKFSGIFRALIHAATQAAE